MYSGNHNPITHQGVDRGRDQDQAGGDSEPNTLYILETLWQICDVSPDVCPVGLLASSTLELYMTHLFQSLFV